jgi:hypothetical protein
MTSYTTIPSATEPKPKTSVKRLVVCCVKITRRPAAARR